MFNTVLHELPIASLHAGHKIAAIERPLVNPDTLKIVAFRVKNFREPENSILLTEHVREHQRRGMLIDHAEDLSSPEDLVRLRELLTINYQLVGKKVKTQKGKKVGTVTSYSFDPETYVIQKLMVEPGGLRALRNPDRLIDRSHIVKTTDKTIVIKDDIQKEKSANPIGVQLGAKNRLQTEAAQTETD